MVLLTIGAVVIEVIERNTYNSKKRNTILILHLWSLY
jgi:hypothetical protein